MYYLNLNSDDFDLLRFDPRVYRFYVEVDDKGSVIRELALDIFGNIVHVYPHRKFKYGERGMFDLASFEVKNLKNNLTSDEFEKLWSLIEKKGLLW